MAKKDKKNITAHQHPKTQEAPKPGKSFELIRFDWRTKTFLFISTALFLIGVLFKIHGSSIPIWNQVANDGSSLKRGLLYGTPQSIRSDEWLVQAPFILSQVKNNFELNNESIGPPNTALLISLPVKHFIMIFKPNLWGYFFLDEERAFALGWNMKIFGLIIGVFLALMLLTRNNFIVSLVGTLWMFLSSGMQWWFSTYLPEMTALVSLMFVAFIYFLYSEKLKNAIIFGALFIYLGIFFFTILYPPYQVPLVYLLLFLIAAYIASNFKKEKITAMWQKKIGLSAIFLVFTGGILFLYYSDIKEIVHLITNTVYPGKRSELGGTGFTSNAFSEYLGYYIGEGKFPSSWSNICELSHFLTFTPIILLSVVIIFFTDRKINYGIIILLVFQVILYLWIWVGFPEFLAKITLLNMSPAYRAMIPLGVSNIFITCLFLSDREIYKTNKSVWKIVVFVASLIFLFMVGNYINDKSGSFFQSDQVTKMALFFAVMYLLIFMHGEKKIYAGIFGVLLILFLGKNVIVNPVSQGLQPIRNNGISKLVTEINKNDPGKWVVFGQFTFSNFLMASGLNVLSGVKYAPMFDKLKILDPLGKNDSTYNRYAHTSYYSMVTPNDSIGFHLIQSDHYAVSIDPCSPELKKLGIKYMFFTYQPNPVEVRTLTPVHEEGVFIYKNKL